MTGQQFKVQRSVMGGTAALPADLRNGGGGSQDREGSGVAYGEPGRELSHETLTDGVGYSDRGASRSRCRFLPSVAHPSFGQHRRKTSSRPVSPTLPPLPPPLPHHPARRAGTSSAARAPRLPQSGTHCAKPTRAVLSRVPALRPAGLSRTSATCRGTMGKRGARRRPSESGGGGSLMRCSRRRRGAGTTRWGTSRIDRRMRASPFMQYCIYRTSGWSYLDGRGEQSQFAIMQS